MEKKLKRLGLPPVRDVEPDKKNPLAGAHPDAIQQLRDILARVAAEQAKKPKK